MSIKTILAPITGNDSDRSVLNAALMISRITKAQIQVLFIHRDPKVVMVPHFGYGLSTGMINSLIQSAEEQLEHASHAAISNYIVWKKETGVVELNDPESTTCITSTYSESIGDVFTILATAGRMVDVICLVRDDENTEMGESSMIQAGLFETGKPVVLVPGDSNPEDIKSIAIAWNGSLEAARTVALAMPLLEAVDSVSVLAATSDSLKPEDVTAFTQSLKRHGINANSRMFPLNSRLFPLNRADLTRQLQDEAQKCNAQLLVLGAYSHSRLRELVLGGVTDAILNDGRMPVLMAH